MHGKGRQQYLFKDNVPLPKKLKSSLLRGDGNTLPSAPTSKCNQDERRISNELINCVASSPDVYHETDASISLDGNLCHMNSHDGLPMEDVHMEEVGLDGMNIEHPMNESDIRMDENTINHDHDHLNSPRNSTEAILSSITVSGDFVDQVYHDPNDIRDDGYFSDDASETRRETENFFENLKGKTAGTNGVKSLPKSVKIRTEKDPRMLFLMVLNFSLKNMLSFSAIIGLLMIMNFVCDSKVLPDTRYSFDKFCNSKIDYDLHSTCPRCTEYLGTFGNREVVSCGTCSNSVDMTNPSNGCFFVIFNPTDPVRDYLQMYEDYYDNIMKSKVHEKNHLKDIYDGKLYRKFRSKLDPPDKHSYATFVLNTDGVPLFESSKGSVWPIYLMLNEIPRQKRFECLILAGLWIGNSKPVMDIFLEKFVKQMNELSTNGISCTIKGEQRTIKLFTLQCSVDTIARFPMNGTKQFNAAYGCDWCLQEGFVPQINPNDNSRVYPYVFPLESRTRENTLLFAEEALRIGKSFMGVVYSSPLLNLQGFDIINSFSPEYMHQYLAGVVAQLTDFIISDLSTVEFEELNRLLIKIRVPNQLGRLSRSLIHRSDFKCKEWENWALYYSLPLLSRFMKNRSKLKHWSLLVNSLHICLSEDIRFDDLNKVNDMLHEFVKDLTKFYPLKAHTYNVHQLLHLAESIFNWGPLWAHSAFAFESANRGLLASIHSEKGVILQIIRHANIIRYRQILENAVYKDCSDIERAYCDGMAGNLNQKVVKLTSASYFGTGQLVSQKFALRFSIPEEVLSYGRAVIDGCLFMTTRKENSRTCNYYAQLKNGKFVEIMNFLIDFDNRKEFVLCRTLQVRKHFLSDSIREITGIYDREGIINTDDIDRPCVLVAVGTKEFLTPVPNKLYY